MNNILAKNNFKDILYITFLLLWFISSNLITYRYISILLFAIISFSQITIILKRGRLYINKQIWLYILFSIWGFLSVIWGTNKDAIIDKSIDLLCNSLFLIVSYDYFIETKISQKKFFLIFIIVGICFSFYVLNYYGINNYFSLLSTGNRVGGEIINVNFIGVVCIITFLMIVYTHLFGILKNKLLLILSLVPFVVSLGTGSKKVIICLALGLFIMIMLFLKGKLTIKKIIKFLIIIILAIFVFVEVKNSGYFNEIFFRLNNMIYTYNSNFYSVDGSTILRRKYIMKGIETFYNQPIIGIGLNNSMLITYLVNNDYTYLHCNYIELLACTGIVGFVLYYSIFILCIKKYKNSKKKNSFSIILLFLLLFIDVGSVTYYEIKTAMYFILVFILLDKEKWGKELQS